MPNNKPDAAAWREWMEGGERKRRLGFASYFAPEDQLSDSGKLERELPEWSTEHTL